MQYRNEFKHIINYQEYTLTKLRLKSLLPLDENTGSDSSYTIRSFYFDDYYNNAYHDKYAGIADRCKYRIRIYNQSESTVHLEKKIKKNSYNHKQVAPLTVEEVY